MQQAKVAFQGARGAFSEQACRLLLGDELDFRPCERFTDVFEALAAGAVDYAVLPIENTLAGSIYENYDHLLEYRLPIIGEARVRIIHNLIGRPGAQFDQIRRAISHPVALSQCISFFRSNPQIRAESHWDTGGSVRTVMEGDDPTTVAIASEAAAELYGGEILRRSIEDNSENFTRFFLLARQPPEAPLEGSAPLKTSIVFATRHAPGALFKCMAAFALRDVNLTKIESRPLRGRPWEYLFYLDLEGSPTEEHVANALRHLEEATESLTVLGSYRKAA